MPGQSVKLVSARKPDCDKVDDVDLELGLATVAQMGAHLDGLAQRTAMVVGALGERIEGWLGHANGIRRNA